MDSGRNLLLLACGPALGLVTLWLVTLWWLGLRIIGHCRATNTPQAHRSPRGPPRHSVPCPSCLLDVPATAVMAAIGESILALPLATRLAAGCWIAVSIATVSYVSQRSVPPGPIRLLRALPGVTLALALTPGIIRFHEEAMLLIPVAGMLSLMAFKVRGAGGPGIGGRPIGRERVDDAPPALLHACAAGRPRPGPRSPAGGGAQWVEALDGGHVHAGHPRSR